MHIVSKQQKSKQDKSYPTLNGERGSRREARFLFQFDTTIGPFELTLGSNFVGLTFGSTWKKVKEVTQV